MTSPRSKVALLSIAATTHLALPLAIGFLGRIHPAFDSFAEFRGHIAVLLASAAVASLLARERFLGSVALLFAAASILSASGWIDRSRIPLQPSGGPQAVYTLLQLNLFEDNPHPDRALSLIGRLLPDAIALEEVSDAWADRLALLKPTYPYMQVCKAGAVAILSRRPFSPGASPRCLDRERMALAQIDFGGAAVDVGALHLYWPWPFRQSKQIDALRPTLAALGGDAMVAGDFNAVTWSAAVGRVAKAGQLSVAPGVRPSWIPIQLPDALRRYLGLPIDQVLAKGGIVLRSIETAGDAGSDHLPVLVRFSIARGEPQPSAQVRVSLDPAGPG